MRTLEKAEQHADDEKPPPRPDGQPGVQNRSQTEEREEGDALYGSARHTSQSERTAAMLGS